MIGLTRTNPTRIAANSDVIACIVVALLFGADAWHLLDVVALVSPQGVPGIAVDRTTVVCGVAALIALALRVRHLGHSGTGHAVALGAICGITFFARSLGCALIDPQNIQWLLRGDWAEHYASWASYRSGPWVWPPGANPNVWYPVGTAIVYTDSLPLFAIPAKIFRAWLPDTFQYIGIALAFNFTLQGIFAALLMHRAKASAAAMLAGCLLFLFAPVLIWRIGHDTLTAHWLILAAMWLYFRDDNGRSLTREIAPWCVLAFVAALVHPYFPPMIMAIALAYWTRRIHIDRARSLRAGAAAIASMLTVVAIAWWISGVFTLRSRDASGGIAMGTYTSNLLTFVDSAGFSQLIPPIRGIPGEQWEGAAYLGLGILALVSFLSIEALFRRRVPESARRHWPLLIAALGTALFAVSTTAMLGPIRLTHWDVHPPLIESFRASGRFIWIAFYLVLLAVLWRTVRAFPRAGPYLLTGALALQMWDFGAVHAHFAGLRSGYSWPQPEALLSDPAWDELLDGRKHLTMLPPVACGQQAGPYLPFQLLAAKHARTFNSGYLARWDKTATDQYCDRLGDAIAADSYSGDDVYVVGPDLSARIGNLAGMRCRKIDGYDACVISEAR